MRGQMARAGATRRAGTRVGHARRYGPLVYSAVGTYMIDFMRASKAGAAMSSGRRCHGDTPGQFSFEACASMGVPSTGGPGKSESAVRWGSHVEQWANGDFHRRGCPDTPGDDAVSAGASTCAIMLTCNQAGESAGGAMRGANQRRVRPCMARRTDAGRWTMRAKARAACKAMSTSVRAATCMETTR